MLVGACNQVDAVTLSNATWTLCSGLTPTWTSSMTPPWPMTTCDRVMLAGGLCAPSALISARSLSVSSVYPRLCFAFHLACVVGESADLGGRVRPTTPRQDDPFALQSEHSVAGPRPIVGVIAEPARLARTAGRVRPRVQEDHDRPVRRQ